PHQRQGQRLQVLLSSSSSPTSMTSPYAANACSVLSCVFCPVPVVRHQEHHENGREKQDCGDTKDNPDDFVEIEGHNPAGSKDKPEKHEFVSKHEQETIFHFCLRVRLHTCTEHRCSGTARQRCPTSNRD